MKDWSVRPYVPDINYPGQERVKSAKSQYDLALEANPSLAEFSNNIPGQELISGFTEFLAQSNFKKPYLDQSYPEMEYVADPPTGIDPQDPNAPPFDYAPPRIPGADQKCPPDGAIFDVDIEDKICKGLWSTFKIKPTQKVIDVQLIDTGWGIEFKKTNKNWNSIDIFVPDTFPGGYVRFNFLLKHSCGYTAWTNDIVDLYYEVATRKQCSRLYAIIRVVVGFSYQYDKYIVWDFLANEVPTDIPDGTGGFVSFPCAASALVPWRALFKPKLSAGVPGTIDLNRGTSPALRVSPYPAPPFACIPGVFTFSLTSWTFEGSQFFESVNTSDTAQVGDCTEASPFRVCNLSRLLTGVFYPTPPGTRTWGGYLNYGISSNEGRWDYRWMEENGSTYSQTDGWVSTAPPPGAGYCANLSSSSDNWARWFHTSNGIALINTGEIRGSWAGSFNFNSVMIGSAWNQAKTAPMWPDAVLTFHGASVYSTMGTSVNEAKVIVYAKYAKAGFIFAGALHVDPMVRNLVLEARIQSAWNSAKALIGYVDSFTWSVEYIFGTY